MTKEKQPENPILPLLPITEVPGIPTSDQLNKLLDSHIAMLHMGIDPLKPRPQSGVNQGSGQFMTEGRPATARFLFKEALAHWNKGDHKTAHQLLEAGVRMFPDSDKDLNPHEKHMLYNLELRYGISLMSQGLLEEGWKYYNRRKEPNSMGFSPARDMMLKNLGIGSNQSQWTGQSLAGKVLVIYPEQGLGDQLLGLRPLIAGWFMPLLNDIKELRIEAHWELQPILKRHLKHHDQIKVVDPAKTMECIEGADYACSYMDFLQHMAPAKTGTVGQQDFFSLLPDPKKVKDWQLPLDLTVESQKCRHLIGINWRGHGDKWDKGVQIQDLKPLWLLLKLRPDVHVVVCHPLTLEDQEHLDLEWRDMDYDGCTRSWRDQVHAPFTLPEHKGIMIDPPTLEDYLGVLAQCDYYVGVMSTTCHLAGALGLQTKVLAPIGPRTPWYWAMDAKADGGYSSWYQGHTEVFLGDVWPMKGETYDKPWSTGLWWKICGKLTQGYL